jgi:nucleoside-diphosphate-sugar epimerase
MGGDVRRVLVTGSAGFVGRAFRRALERDDVLEIDLADGHDVRDYFREAEERFDLVVHLAAVVGGRAKIEREPLAIAVDLAIDADLFGWALRTRPGRIVYFSSSAAYPVHLQDGVRQRRLREDDIALERDLFGRPDLSYGWAKLTGEYLASLAEAEGLRVHVFRPFSGYGSDQDPAYPFRAFLERARRREDPFTIWGDGRTVRDWIHVDDVVAATLRAVEEDVPGPVNLCTGRPTSFEHLALAFAEAAGYRPGLRYRTDAPRGVAYRVGDPEKMRAFYPEPMSLEEGIARALG